MHIPRCRLLGQPGIVIHLDRAEDTISPSGHSSPEYSPPAAGLFLRTVDGGQLFSTGWTAAAIVTGSDALLTVAAFVEGFAWIEGIGTRYGCEEYAHSYQY